MENAADALKIVLAIFIFSIGLMILFNMASQAKETARIMIAETDPTKYYNYFEEIDEKTVDANGNRIVELKDIIPALYRYSEENYGVTIIDKDGNIVARFDLDTERICNSWINALPERKRNFIIETRYTFMKANRLAELINNKENTIKFYENIDVSTSDGAINYEDMTSVSIDETEMVNLFDKLYGQNLYNSLGNRLVNINRPYYCYWIGNTGWTAQRIDSDLSRNRCTF